MQRHHLLNLILGAMLAVSVTACKSKLDEVKPAEVSEPAEQAVKEEAKPSEEAAAEEKAESKEIAVNTVDSSITFLGKHVGPGTHVGGFSKWEGKATVAGEALEKLDIKIDVDSVYTDDDENVNVETYKQNDASAPAITYGKFTGHLKSPDFFDVAKFPEATFTATKFMPGGEEGATHTISGDLTLHGVTKAISFPATIKVESGTLEAHAEFAINRFDFGVTYEGKSDNLIDKRVALTINLKFPLS